MIFRQLPQNRLPIYPDEPPSGRFKNFSKIVELYSTDSICPIVAFPYMIFNFWANVLGAKNIDNEIMREIVKSTSRPNHIIKLVQEFQTKFLTENYISIHWRYNEDDWYHGVGLENAFYVV